MWKFAAPTSIVYERLCLLSMHILEVNGLLAGCGCDIEGVCDFAWICELLFTIPGGRLVGVISRGQRARRCVHNCLELLVFSSIARW